MALTSLLFIFVFLPLSYGLTRLSKKTNIQNVILFILSLLFYAWGSVRDAALLLIVIAFSYLSGLQMDDPTLDATKRKRLLIITVAFNLCILCFYKYLTVWLGALGFSGLENVHAPAGLSFYLFTILSYDFDVYYQKAPVQKNFISLGVYTAFFGKLLMGPISQYHHFEEQLKSRSMTRRQFNSSMNLFFAGLAKKVLLADLLAAAFGALQQDGSVLGAWLLALSYTFELYFDFSGYSDMAIGIGRMFGFDIEENFNYPYLADSVQNFWRRWHISLSRWFRDYVYIPLGGSRCSKEKYIRNILIVWLLTGVWHGASFNFIVWGLYYAALLLGEHFVWGKHLEKLPHPVRIGLTFLLAMIGWVFFFSPNLLSAFGVLGRMIFIGAEQAASSKALFVLSSYWLILAAAVFFSLRGGPWISQKLFERFKGQLVWPAAIFKIIVFVMIIACLVSSSAQTFLYGAF